MIHESIPPREHAEQLKRITERGGTLAERREYMENNVPEKYRDLVATHYHIWWNRSGRHLKKHGVRR